MAPRRKKSKSERGGAEALPTVRRTDLAARIRFFSCSKSYSKHESSSAQAHAGERGLALTVNCKIGLETKIRAGPNPWKKAAGPSVLRICNTV